MSAIVGALKLGEQMLILVQTPNMEKLLQSHGLVVDLKINKAQHLNQIAKDAYSSLIVSAVKAFVHSSYTFNEIKIEEGSLQANAMYEELLCKTLIQKLVKLTTCSKICFNQSVATAAGTIVFNRPMHIYMKVKSDFKGEAFIDYLGDYLASYNRVLIEQKITPKLCSVKVLPATTHAEFADVFGFTCRSVDVMLGWLMVLVYIADITWTELRKACYCFCNIQSTKEEESTKPEKKFCLKLRTTLVDLKYHSVSVGLNIN
uniref:Uncharacterized protein n=1 Tax=Glossina pallidipes TaxID=7398 RepID=A0A1B0A8Z2_GLOPL